MSKATKKSSKAWLVGGVIAVLAALGVIAAVGTTITVNVKTQGYEAHIEYAPAQKPAMVIDDQGELVEDEGIPTVDEVDGGKFEDADTGLSAGEGEYADFGWAEWYPVETPEAFKNATLGQCIYANNKFGAQCVSLARVFWWSYADRDVTTCGTGMAKGMMNCAEQNAGDDFDIYWADAKWSIQAGDWLVFDGGLYGHVGMALGPEHNGYVTLLGENQGGAPCAGGGAATNIININLNKLIGYYRPKAYIKVEPAPEPEPEPAPAPEANEVTYTYVKGDYFSKVLVNLGLDEGHLWGDDGTVAYYTEQLIAQDMLDENGNVKIGKPFTLVRR